MKLKRSSICALILGVVILAFALAMPVLYLESYATNGAVNIIGGVGTPTYKTLLFSLLEGLPFALVLLGVSLIVSATFCLIFSKTVNAHCSITTSIISLGLSAIGAAGLVCVLVWFITVAFGEAARHPILHPVSIILGIICLLAFIVLILVYFKARKTKPSAKGIVIDALTSIIYLSPFFFVLASLYEIIENLI